MSRTCSPFPPSRRKVSGKPRLAPIRGSPGPHAAPGLRAAVFQVVGSALHGNETDVFDETVGAAMDADRVMYGREAAVESPVMELAPPGCLKMVNQILLALITDDIDQGIFQLRVFIKYFEVRPFRKGKVDCKKTRVGIFPLIETGNQFRFKVLLAHIVIKGLMGIKGAANEFIRLDNRPVLEFDALCLIIFDDDSLDYAAADDSASIFGYVLAD